MAPDANARLAPPPANSFWCRHGVSATTRSGDHSRCPDAPTGDHLDGAQIALVDQPACDLHPSAKQDTDGSAHRRNIAGGDELPVLVVNAEVHDRVTLLVGRI